MSSAHYEDLREIYAKRMEYHGNGYGLLQPISTRDLSPPCVGYIDRNGDWTLIANLTADPAAAHPDYTPLAYAPRRVTEMDIEWQPKTSLGVTAATLDASAETPDTLPGGAGATAHVKYATRSKFGAVLMTLKPVHLHAYNDERLFRSWLDANRAALARHHGPELRRCGLWLVTRTHSARGASINTWTKDNRSALVSIKAKAAMLGELGQNLDFSDKLFDKDWCHYKAKGRDEGLVLFLDGCFDPGRRWWLESVKQVILGRPAPPSEREYGKPKAHPAVPPPPPVSSRGRESDGTAYDGVGLESKGLPNGTAKHGTTAALPRRVASLQRPDRPSTLVADHDEDLDVLRDAGVLQFGRAASLRRSSCAGSARSHSLRRESRSIADEKDKLDAQQHT